MQRPAVSVIIPTCRRNQELKNAVASVINQTVKDIELIVIDDNGEKTDDTIEKFLSGLNSVYLKNGRNYGGAVSRNRGVQIARGEYIAFLDDDDQWENQKLEKQLSIMRSTKAGICYTGLTICKGNRSRYSFREPAFCDHYISILNSNFIGTTSSVLIPTKILKEINGFDTALPALQDYDLYIRILKNNKAIWIDEPLVIYSNELHGNKISCNRAFFKDAANKLLEKYHNESEFKLLQKSIKRIELMKMVRSKRFFFDTLYSLCRFGKFK
jgi:glycosyltransferase involved in cell wall biosynthesis